MSLKARVAVLALATTTLSCGPAAALTCFDLPEYARAVGTLQGLSTCDMSVAEARRVVAAQNGGNPQPSTERVSRHRRHRTQQAE